MSFLDIPALTISFPNITVIFSTYGDICNVGFIYSVFVPFFFTFSQHVFWSSCFQLGWLNAQLESVCHCWNDFLAFSRAFWECFCDFPDAPWSYVGLRKSRVIVLFCHKICDSSSSYTFFDSVPIFLFWTRNLSSLAIGLAFIFWW